jgi:hypothetical protein
MTQNQTTAALSPAGIFSPMQQRDFVRGLYSVLLGLGFIALLISFLALLAPQELHAEETTTPQANADELQAGLYFNAGLQDQAFRAPELNAEVKIAVFGLVQRFWLGATRHRAPTLQKSDKGLAGRSLRLPPS